MGTGAIHNGYGVGGGFAADGSSRKDIENQIDRLERLLEENKRKQREDSDSRDKKTDNLEKRIKTLQTRLDEIKSKDDGECQTCKNRKYQDGSDDPGVSFKTASKVGPEGAASAVRGHEQEHVNRNRAKAEREGREIVYQSVVIKTGICPECAKPYVAGGETTTVTRPKRDERFDVGLYDKAENMGNMLDIIA